VLARFWIRLVSILVPGDERSDWLEEWSGEVAACGWRWEYASGILLDAWYLRKDGWTMGRMTQDVRHAVRGLVRKPFFTALAGLTLAVGIGANTAIFSVVDSVLLNPLPYPESDRILSVNHTAPGLNLPVIPYSESMYLLYAEQGRTLERLAAYNRDNVNLMLGGEPERVSSARVTEGFFEVLGVRPALGRGFQPGEDRAGAEPLAVLGHGVWERSFGGDPGVVGRVVEMDGVQRRVVGVMPEGFDFPEGVELWKPVDIDPLDADAGSFSMPGIARMAAGETVATVNGELDQLLLRFADANADDLPRSMLAQAGMRADAKPLKELFVEDLAQALWVVLGTVGFVLLIACANVANLFLVRAESRQREQAVRTALGATRSDMMRYYLTESVALGVGAGVVGLGIAMVGVPALLGIAPVDMPRASEVGIDGSVLAYTAVISILSGLLFGLFPVIGYARRDLSGALKEGGRASTSGPRRHRTRGALVVTQVALALVLLVGSGLMARSFAAMRSIDPGFDAENRLAFRVSLPSAEYPDAETSRVLHRALYERLEAIPGVSAAALASSLPLTGTKNASSLQPSDRPTEEGQIGPVVDMQWVGPGYFEAMGIELLEGRALGPDDAADMARSVVVSESLARTFWPGETSVLGRSIEGQGDGPGVWEVVGVARDVHFESLDQPSELFAYFPLVSGEAGEPSPIRALSIVLHVGDDPLAYVSAAREALREVDPRLPMVEPRTVESLVRDASASTSFTMVLLGIAAGIALLLGAVGIYGVISYVVSQRTQEIGVRMALGAPAGSVVRGVVSQGMTLAGAGVAIGFLGAWAGSRLLGSLLYGVSAHDPLTYAATSAALIGVALLASWLPARRASRIDPVEALRAD
jgi:putative ABC transport system permease protein